MLSKITFIKPNLYSSRSKGALQPLFAAALAAHTPDDIELELYDDRIEEIPFDEPTDLVAINIETFSASRAYQISAEFRKRGIKVIAGGYHPSLQPDEALKYVDAILTGDAEVLWSKVISDIQKGQLQQRYTQTEFIDPKLIRFQRNIFDGKPYGPIEMVQWGRGCPYDCEFCSIKSFYKTGQICRPVNDLIKELETVKKKTVFFIDDNLYHNRSQFIHFLNEIRPLKFKWMCQISITIAQDKELLALMAKSGCFIILIGFESFNSDNLKLMGKQWNTSKMEYDEAIRIINLYGILIYGTFIFGYDHDTKDSFRRAVDFAMEHNFFLANFNPLYPLPGSRLYQRYEKDSRLVSQWWLSKDFYYGKSMFDPMGMSSYELEQNCYDAKLRFNSWSSILRRGSRLIPSGMSLQKLALFFYSNYINRAEVLSKQGKIFGE